MKLHRSVCSILLLVWLGTFNLIAQDTARVPRVDFATYLSGNTETTIAATALDSTGHMYVTGITHAADYPTTPGAFRRTPRQVCNNGSCSYATSFVTKLSRDGSSLIYSTFINEADPLDITVDASGNAYIGGGLVDPDYTGTPGAWRTKCLNPNTAAPNQFCNWIVKLNASGSALVYSTLIDDVRVCFTSYDQRIRVNAANEAYIAGTAAAFASPATGDKCFTTPGAYRTDVSGGGTGTVVMKFNSSGSGLLFSTWVSGTKPGDEFYALAIAPNDHAVVVGSTFHSDFPTSQTAYQRTAKGSNEAFVAKLSSDGSSLLASTLLGGLSNEQATGVAVDSELNVYIAGTTDSADFPTTAGAYRRTIDSTNCGDYPGVQQQCLDTFVAKLPPDFSLLTYSTFLGGKGDDANPFLTIDPVGHVYLFGSSAPNYPLVKPLETNYRPLYVTKLNTSGSGLLFSTYFGGTADGGSEWPSGIEVDDAGNAYIALTTSSTNFPTTSNAYQTSNHSDSGAGFLAKIDIPPCTLGSSVPSVTICAPASGAVSSSPVLISAGATDDHAIEGMAVYVDNGKKFEISGASHFDTNVVLPAGTHHLTVKAWDADGRVFRAAEDISVH